MKKLISLAILGVLVLSSGAFAQFSAVIYTFDTFTNNCDGTGGMLEDGMQVVTFYWDQDNDGPDATDPIAPGAVQAVYPLNGNDYLGVPGAFYSDPAFTYSNFTPNPSRFFIRVVGASAVWTSVVFQISSGYSERDLTDSTWTCETIINNCPTPAGIANLQATTTQCTGVTLTWNLFTDNDRINTFRVLRNGVRIATIPHTAITYFDPDALVGDNEYRMVVARDCGPGDTATSNTIVSGTRLPGPPAVNNDSVQVYALSTECAAVVLRWRTPSSIANLDSFCIFRDGFEVDRVFRGSINQLHLDTLRGEPAGLHNYTIAGWNVGCGHGVTTPNHPVTTTQPPAAPTGLAATIGQCTVNLSWNAVAGVNSYRVYRDNVLITTIVAPNTTHSDGTGTPGQTYSYQVSSVLTSNPASCQESARSAGVNGSRIGAPNAPSNIQASDSSSCTTITVTWTDNSNDETGFTVRRGGVDIITVGVGVTTYNDITGLLPGTTYNYTVVANNNCGASSAPATNPGTLKQAPPQVLGVNATDNLSDRVTVTWTNTIRETSYNILRDAIQVGTVGVDVTTYDDFSASPNVVYQYTVLAVNDCGNGAMSVSNTGRRCALLQAPELFVTQGECVVSLTWTQIAQAASYRIYRDGEFRAAVDGGTNSFIDDQAAPYVAYIYTMTASNSCAEGPQSAPVTGDRIATPPTPTNLHATDALCGQIIVTWQDVTLEDGYIIRRNGVVIGATSADETTFVYSALTPRAAFRVQAINLCGASFGSAIDSGGTDVAPSLHSIVASSPACDGVTLSYISSTNADSVRIYRDAVLIATLAGSSGVFEDSPPAAGEYQYTAEAVGDCGVSALVGPVTGALLAYPTGPHNLIAVNDGCATITLSWTPASGSFGYYELLRDGELILTLPNDATQYADANAIGGIEYLYTVKAVNDTCGASIIFDSVAAAITLSALPAAPNVVISIENTDAVLQWSAVDSTIAGCPIEPTRYLVYFSELSDGPFFYHGSTQDTVYRHVEVVRFTQDMYYLVETFVGDVDVVSGLPVGGVITRADALRRLNERGR